MIIPLFENHRSEETTLFQTLLSNVKAERRIFLENYRKKMSRNKTLCKNERGLIEAVKKRPVLYDKLHKHYRKPLQTDHAWLSVAADVGGERGKAMILKNYIKM